MKLKKLLTLAVAGVLFIGGVVTANAAELDTAWYAKQNPDVVAALGDSPEAMKLHYNMFGKKEGRMANTHDVEAQLRRLFKAEEYAARYPDIKAAFGADVEAMFQHYISYGLLEGRRPSEKVSQEAAISLKKTVEKAMADAGIAVAPGSAQLVEIITGTVAADKGGAAVQQALANVAPAIEKAVTDTAKEANAPAASSSGSSSSSGSPSSSNTPQPPATVQGDAIWATLADRGTGDSAASDDVKTALTALNNNGSTNVTSTVADGVTTVTFSDITIPKHSNGDSQAYFVGIGVPYVNNEENTYTYSWGWCKENTTANTAPTSQMTKDGQEYATFYWGWSSAESKVNNSNVKGYLVVKSGGETVATYTVDFSSITCAAEDEESGGSDGGGSDGTDTGTQTGSEE